ncbi:MAG: hypothetical protein ACJAYB_000111 [Psychromonas sp.]|jgi:hypothetical protein
MAQHGADRTMAQQYQQHKRYVNMTYATKLIVNELLVRYDDLGEPKGAYCKHIEQMVDLDSGKVHSTKEMPLQPLKIGSDEFKAVITQVQNDALAKIDLLKSEVAQLNFHMQEKETEILALKSQSKVTI